jgi:hypothetical protein
MNRDVTKAGNGVIVVPRISGQLRHLLNHREVIAGYGGDAGTDGGGEFRRGPWIRPEWVDIRERDEARAALPAFEHLAGPVPEQVIVDFLNFLWISTRHAADQTFDGICLVYPRMLRQFPAYCWRPDKLDLAPHAFPKFFPTVGEIAAFLQPDKVWIEEEIAGLRGVAEANINPNAGQSARSPGRRPWAEGGAEDHAQYLRDKADRERRELVEIMRQRDLAEGRQPADATPPARGPHEDGKAYVSRLTAWMGGQISLGAKARRADEDRYRRAKEMEREERAMQTRRRTSPPTEEQMQTAYGETKLKSRDVRDADTASESAQNTMSCDGGGA